MQLNHLIPHVSQTTPPLTLEAQPCKLTTIKKKRNLKVNQAFLDAVEKYGAEKGSWGKIADELNVNHVSCRKAWEKYKIEQKKENQLSPEIIKRMKDLMNSNKDMDLVKIMDVLDGEFKTQLKIQDCQSLYTKIINGEIVCKPLKVKVVKAIQNWTLEEDNLLEELVNLHGTEYWTLIANTMSEQVRELSNDQCRNRWKIIGANFSEWTIEENENLGKLYEKFPNDWIEIAEGIPNRTSAQCKQHYMFILNSKIKQGEWTEEEDQKLMELYNKYPNQWSEIAKEMQSRVMHQCELRWLDALAPPNKHGEWTKEENEKLKKLYYEYDGRWSEIARGMLGRSYQQCYSHWESLDPTIKHEKWTKEENEKLKKLYEKFPNKWSKIALDMPGRSAKQCAGHWKRTLDSTIKRGKWTKEEDEQLKALYDKHGGKWTEIAKEMPGRTYDQCWRRFNVQMPKKTKPDNDKIKTPKKRKLENSRESLPNKKKKLIKKDG